MNHTNHAPFSSVLETFSLTFQKWLMTYCHQPLLFESTFLLLVIALMFLVTVSSTTPADDVSMIVPIIFMIIEFGIAEEMKLETEQVGKGQLELVRYCRTSLQISSSIVPHFFAMSLLAVPTKQKKMQTETSRLTR